MPGKLNTSLYSKTLYSPLQNAITNTNRNSMNDDISSSGDSMTMKKLNSKIAVGSDETPVALINKLHEIIPMYVCKVNNDLFVKESPAHAKANLTFINDRESLVKKVSVIAKILDSAIFTRLIYLVNNSDKLCNIQNFAYEKDRSTYDSLSGYVGLFLG